MSIKSTILAGALLLGSASYAQNHLSVNTLTQTRQNWTTPRVEVQSYLTTNVKGLLCVFQESNIQADFAQKENPFSENTTTHYSIANKIGLGIQERLDSFRIASAVSIGHRSLGELPVQYIKTIYRNWNTASFHMLFEYLPKEDFLLSAKITAEYVFPNRPFDRAQIVSRQEITYINKRLTLQGIFEQQNMPGKNNNKREHNTYEIRGKWDLTPKQKLHLQGVLGMRNRLTEITYTGSPEKVNANTFFFGLEMRLQ